MSARSELLALDHSYTGHFLRFEPRRSEVIRRTLEERGEFYQAFSATDWTFEPREIALLSLDPAESCVSGVVLMERTSGTGGTGTRRMKLHSPVLIDPPLSERELSPSLLLDEVVSTPENLSRLPEHLWSELISSIVALRPELEIELQALFVAREQEHRVMGSDPRTLRLIEQRDAIGLTLDICGLDRQRVLGSLDASRRLEAGSILDLLDGEPLYERDALHHDQRIFGELLTWDHLGASFTGEGGREVVIRVSDGKPLESVVGTDLLIYQDDYRSFLLLQYKMMEQVRGGRSEGRRRQEWSYTVDEQLHTQLRSMAEVHEAIEREGAPAGRMADWRLNESPFYLKFCERTRPNARDDSLIRGLILERKHLLDFLSLSDSEGRQQARRIGYETCPRYLSNTQFVELARGGWIGCDQRGYTVIERILRANQSGGRQTMFAAVWGSAPQSALDRRKWRR